MIIEDKKKRGNSMNLESHGTITPLLENIVYYINGIQDAREGKINENRLQTLGDIAHEFYMYGVKDEGNSRMIASTTGTMIDSVYHKALSVLSSSTAIYQATNIVEPLIIQTQMSVENSLLDHTNVDDMKNALEQYQLDTEEYEMLAKQFAELYLSTFNSKITIAQKRLINVANGKKAAEDLSDFMDGIQESRKIKEKEISLKKYQKKGNMFIQGMIADKTSRSVATVNGEVDTEKYDQTLLLLTIDISQSEANSDLSVLDYEERKAVGTLNAELLARDYHKNHKAIDDSLKTIENTFLNGYTDMYNMKLGKTK